MKLDNRPTSKTAQCTPKIVEQTLWLLSQFAGHALIDDLAGVKDINPLRRGQSAVEILLDQKN